MYQKYTVAEHGDLFEKKGATFIRDQFPNYELVWQTYIGNATYATLPNYPDERKRESFAEHSYTTFESCFMIKYLLDSGIFTAAIANAEDVIRLNQSFTLFFTYLGRIRDNILKAASDLSYDYRYFAEALKGFYDARNIVLHGKKVPIMLDQEGYLVMPVLETRYAKGKAWNDKDSNWSDVEEMESAFVSDSCDAYFNELIKLINEEYGRFYGIIASELSKNHTQLAFDRSKEIFISNDIPDGIPPSSGSTSVRTGATGPIDVYRIKESLGLGKN